MIPSALPCPNCGCSSCCSTCADGGPDQLQVDISGFTDGGFCSTCDETYNGTFVLDRYCGSCRISVGDDESVTVCGWSYTFSSPCAFFGSTFDKLIVSFADGGSGTTVVRVMLKVGATIDSDCTSYVEWSTTDTLPACKSLSAYEVPYSFPFGSTMTNGGTCSFDGSSVFLTAL